MAKKLEVRKVDFDSVLRKMIGSRTVPLSSIKIDRTKPAKIIGANSSRPPQSGKA